MRTLLSISKIVSVTETGVVAGTICQTKVCTSPGVIAVGGGGKTEKLIVVGGGCDEAICVANSTMSAAKSAAPSGITNSLRRDLIIALLPFSRCRKGYSVCRGRLRAAKMWCQTCVRWQMRLVIVGTRQENAARIHALSTMTPARGISNGVMTGYSGADDSVVRHAVLRAKGARWRLKCRSSAA